MLPVCKFFRSEQGCKFGNKCRYRHTDSFSPPFSDQSFHQRNENEGSVRSQHKSRATSSTTSRGFYSRRQDGSLVNFPSQSSDLEARFQNLETSHYKDEAINLNSPNSASVPGKICHYFARNGNCCFGSRCRFVHVQPHTVPPRFQEHYARHSATETEADGQAQGPQDGQTEERERVSSSGRYSQRNFSSCPADGATQARSSVKAPFQGGAGDENHENGGNPAGTEDKSSRSQQVKTDKVCQFYLAGKCWRGSRCKFVHPQPSAESSKRNAALPGNRQERDPKVQKAGDSSDTNPKRTQATEGVPSASQSSQRTESRQVSARQPRPPYVAQGTKKYRRDEVDEVEASRLRRTEIEQLIKRFPKNKVKVNRDCAEYFQCIVTFSPTDPDWPFDVTVFELQIDIPADYPFEMMTISLPEEQDLPETVRRYVEVSIEEWLENKERQLEENGQVELVFRPFLRWLDRNIEDIVTEGLKQMKRELVARASGLEFVSAKQLQKQYPGQSAGNPDDDDQDETDETASDSEEEDDDDEESSSDYGGSEEDQSGDDNNREEKEDDENKGKKSHQDRIKAMLADPERKGTEIMLKNLQLKESAATLYFDKICLSIQCERCKGTSEFMASPGRVNMVQCGQCSQTQMATYRPAMAHQFSSVIGFLDLDACLPFDVILQNSNVTISCMHCSKETKPGAVLPGQPQDHWCRVCHHKLRIATDGVRFTQLEPSKAIQSIKSLVKVVVPTRKRIPKDPAIQEGKPLPNFGTCKHYKKSYRWLRFPCCGKCYPCDTCHDLKEDHEMKFANRMICGFCCKEQPYAAERPCKGCDMNMTKVHTKHWEGGQGCRDKITMCRNDKQKHRNMSKTVSKHAQKVKDMQSKKKTKLRHT